MPKEEKRQGREVSPIRRQQTKWEKEKLVHQDVVRELQRLQKFEDQPLEMWKYVDLELNKYQSKGLEEELPLEMTYFEVDLPSVMSNNEEKIINSDKPTKVEKSTNIEDKST